MPAKRVLSVGQCYADSGSITRTLEKHFQAQVVSADSADEALSLLRDGSFDLVLANRVFDADGASGLDLIRRIKVDEKLKDVPVMLVSNYDDAQRQAVQLGAAYGFGKAGLGQVHGNSRLREILNC